MEWKKLRDVTDSEKVNKLSLGAEVLFYRLIMKADAYGIFYASPTIIKSLCFPLKETIRTSEITRWLDELNTPLMGATSKDATALIRIYTAEGKSFLKIENFGQVTGRWKSKYPPPPDVDIEKELEKDEEEDAPHDFSKSSLTPFAQKPLLPLDSLKEKFFADVQWIEIAGMKISKTANEVRGLVEKFILHLKSEKVEAKTEKDFIQHFFNWASKKGFNNKQDARHIIPGRAVTTEKKDYSE